MVIQPAGKIRSRTCLFNLVVKYDGPRRRNRSFPGTKHADDSGKNRDDGDHSYDIVNVLADVGDDAPERITAKDCRADPENAAENIEEQVARVGHFCSACDGRTKGANDGNEARENHGAAAVLFIEIVCTLKMAPAEKEGVFAAIERGPCGAANPVADLVAGDGAKHDWKQKPFQGNNASVGEDAGGDQKRVTRKKKSNEKAGFDKDDGANERSAAGAN